MQDYAAVVYTKVVGKKFIFFKEKNVYFQAIYYDNKFFKKKKWPNHLGSLFVKFFKKETMGSAPKRLTLDLSYEEDPTYPRVTYSPTLEDVTEFVNNISGDFEILDAANYCDNKANVAYDVYNIYDRANKQYVVYVDGYVAGGSNGKHKKALNLVSNGIRKVFNSKSTWTDKE